MSCSMLGFELWMQHNTKAIFTFWAAPAHINWIGLDSGLDIKQQKAPHSSENQQGVTFCDFTEELQQNVLCSELYSSNLNFNIKSSTCAWQIPGEQYFDIYWNKSNFYRIYVRALTYFAPRQFRVFSIRSFGFQLMTLDWFMMTYI